MALESKTPGHAEDATGGIEQRSNTDADHTSDTPHGMTTGQYAVEYVRAGYALVPIPRGQKGPSGLDAKGWQLPENLITDAAGAAQLDGNVGIAHGYSGTCTVDIDNLVLARVWWGERGIEIDELLAAPDAVRPESGRPDRAKLLYRRPAGQGLLPMLKPAGSGLELRCAKSDGTGTVQDVLPPSIHPETGQSYRWNGRGDFRQPPVLPDDVLAVWLHEAGTTTPRNGGDVPPGEILVGERNNTFASMAGTMRRRGMGVKAIFAALKEENERCEKRLPEQELRTIARSIGKYSAGGGAKLEDFYAYMPTHSYLYIPTRELWPASSVNARVPWPVGRDQKCVAPAKWLDENRPIEQMAWHPAEPTLIRNRVLQVSGWAEHAGASVFNRYRAPAPIAGDACEAGRWVEHVHKVYPDEAAHIIAWLAHRVQRPGDKVNHALVLGGEQGVGKDTILEPVKCGVGPWNWQDISPSQMLGRFNGWTMAVITRINEARDLGEVDRFSFYDHSKVYMAAPPDVIRVDEKHLREHYVANVMGVIITTNHKSDGIYLPADDRRHFVAWSPRSKDHFPDGYWADIYGWFERGGTGHVCAYLRELDLATFDAKAPPPKTAAFWSVVAASEAPESGELRDVLDSMNNPRAITLQAVAAAAEDLMLFGLRDELRDRKGRRSVSFKFERVGYVPVRNPDSPSDGLFTGGGRRQVVYAAKALSLAEQVRAAKALSLAEQARDLC